MEVINMENNNVDHNEVERNNENMDNQEPVQESENTQKEMEETISSNEEETASSKEHVETEETSSDGPHIETPQQDSTTAPKMKTSFIKKHKNALTFTGCFLLAGVGGFGGTYLANEMTGANKTVLYQNTSTNNSDKNTANTSSMSVKDVANETMNSVVEIRTESIKTNEFFQQAISSGAGSGVILSKDGYIVTNNHVIDGANKVTVKTKDGKEYNAKLVGTDSTTDLAVIKIEATDLTPVVLGTSKNLQVGDAAIAIGNPLGELGGTVTNGIISALDREITIDGESMHLLQTNAAINPGNSGGGLFNDQGQLIGIVNAKSSGSNIEGLGFAIPIDIAKPVITSLIENGKVEGRAELGVSLQEYQAQNQNPFEENNSSTAVYIVQVQSGKAADKAGLKRGDRILEVDGKEIKEVSDVKSVISSHKAGDTIKIKIERDNKEQTVSVTLLEVSDNTTEKTAFTN